jgi:proline iminopeptidase
MAAIASCASIAIKSKNYGQSCETQQIKKLKMQAIKVGGVQLVKLDNGFKVWTKRVGDGPIKMLLLHGGPGCTHEYFECFEDFFQRDKFQIIYYDQLGSHYSDQPEDISLWTVERFCDEIEQVRQALGLENFYLYGQSWGGLLAIEYALKYQNHLKGLILSNITGSVASYETYLNELRNQLS